ncbi:MAG: PAS domain S-box protein [Cyanobacteria bacterium]|nr:PAS domain S-box protein [Cyanobacteriota bacterium]
MGPETKHNSVLIVDDNPINLKVLSALLTQLDLKVFIATDGERALLQAKRAVPDLILLDVMMPGIDGFEVCQRLKAEQQTAAIPVIFVTALSDAEQKVRAFEIGGADYITKPFQQAELVVRVQHQLRLRQLTQDLEQEIKTRRQREASLQRSEARFHMLIDALPFGIWMRDANDRLVMQNPVDRARFGNQIGSDLADLALTPEQLAHYHKAKKHVGIGQVYRYETTEVLQGQAHTFLRLTAPVPDESGGHAIVGVAIDVTEQQRAIAQLRESEQRFRRAIAEAPVPIMIHAEDGEVLQLSSTWTELSGYRHEDIPTLQAWLERAYGKPAASVIAQTIAQEYHLESRREEGEFTINTADGQQRIWNFSSAPLGTMSDGRRIAISMASDITEQQQAQAALSASERRYRALVEVIPDLMIRQDAEGQYLDLVLSNDIQFIQPDLAHIGTSVYELLPLDLAQQRMAYVHRALQTGEVQIYDFQIEIKGNLHWQEARIIAINNEEVLVIVRDISERKQAEDRLQYTSQRLQEAQRIAKLGNWELDRQTDRLYWSDEIFHIFEIDQQKSGASYEAFVEVIHPDDREAVNQAYRKHLQEGIPYSIVHRLLMPDGRIKYVQAQCATKHDVEGTAITSRGTVLDITSLKAAEQKRQEAEASLRQIVEGTAAVTERDFFQELVQHISRVCEVRYVFISESTATGFNVLAFSADGQLQGVEDFDVAYEEAPCCVQALQDGLCHHPDSLRTLYPDNQLLSALQAESYLGMRLRNSEGEPIGNLCIIHDRPLGNADGTINLLRIFAARASAELERYQTARQLQELTAELEQRVIERTATLAETVDHLQTEIQQRQILETQLRQSQAQLQDLFDNANDMIQSVNLTDGSLEFVNQAWLDILGYTTQELGQITVFDVLHPNCLGHCMALMERFKTGELQSLDQRMFEKLIG